MNVVNVDINKIIPYWNNPRNNEGTVPRLMESIKSYGFNVPLVVNKDYVVITGHARLKCARKLGMKEVPCVIVNLTDEQAKKYRIADNKIQELSSWNEEELFKELREIGDRLELVDMGFSESEITEAIGSVEQEFDKAFNPKVEDMPIVTPERISEPSDASEDEEIVDLSGDVDESGYEASDEEAEERKQEEIDRLNEQIRKRELEMKGKKQKDNEYIEAQKDIVTCPCCGTRFRVGK